MTKAKIGFIGIGLMGSAMCSRMLDLHYDLTITANRSRERVDALVARGAKEVATSKELAAASDIVMLCVDTSKSVESRIYGDDGVLAGVRDGTVVIDFGTSLPASTVKIGADLNAAGAGFLDAPIGRTPTQALEGKINLMCAGEKTIFDKVEPVLKDLGENVFHLGALSTGHKIKLINNFFAQTVANAMAEAFAVADVLDVERQKVYDVLSAGPGHSPMMDLVTAFALDGDREKLAFSVRNALKDVRYYSDMLNDVGVDSIMVKSALNAFESSLNEDRGDTYVSEQVDFFKQRYESQKTT